MLNKNPRLYRTRGGVMDKGTPRSTKTIVVIGKATLSYNITSYSSLFFNILLLLVFIYFVRLLKLHSSGFNSNIFSSRVKPKSAVVEPSQLVFKIFPKSKILRLFIK